MGRGLDPVWDYYFRVEKDFQSLGLKAKANSAHNNGWCKNCVKVVLMGSQMAGWVPEANVLEEAGNVENARRYKAMSLLNPYTGVPARLRNHLAKCPHSRHVDIPLPVSQPRRKSMLHDVSAGSSGMQSNHSTPIKIKRDPDGKFSEEEQAEFNVHLYHLFSTLEIPFEMLSTPVLSQFMAKYVPQANLPSKGLFYTLAASKHISVTSLSSNTAGSPDFQGLARLAAGFTSVGGVQGVADVDTENDGADMESFHQ
ncbi:uncharacterized protein L203_100864 [Cryptococcus depauperatus CBS 7841]|uniref:Uncharacterized protein n=1 Tax=Cryptococcus depauperatus CBS 7841 TaxID=1295531 RepID=A0A1E3IB23_9TREE|nr:hypothetical protein L203_05057 [Cryptococcus depauperatus CBS 7841]